MTPKETSEAISKMMVLIERATLAVRADRPAVAVEMLRQANEIAEATIFWLKGGSRTFTIGALMSSASH